MALGGLMRERNDFLIESVLSQVGQSPEVVAALAERLGVSMGAVGRRVAELCAATLDDEFDPSIVAVAVEGGRVLEDSSVSLDGLAEGFYSSFCRKCRAYGCRLHPGPHLRPNRGPVIRGPPRADAGPCGPSCYKGSQQEQGQEPGETTAAATQTPGRSPIGGLSPLPLKPAARPVVQKASLSPLVAGSAQPSRSPESGEGSSPREAALAAASALAPARRRASSSLAADVPLASAPSPSGGQWTPWEDSLLHQGLAMWGRQPCKVAAFFVGARTCADVAERMAAVAPLGPEGIEGCEGEGAGPSRRKGRWNRKKASGVKRAVPAGLARERLNKPIDEASWKFLLHVPFWSSFSDSLLCQ
jgi:hypothetical protein